MKKVAKLTIISASPLLIFLRKPFLPDFLWFMAEVFSLKFQKIGFLYRGLIRCGGNSHDIKGDRYMANNLDKPAVKIKVFEGFAGVGITRLALEDFAKKLGIEFEYVGYSEIDKGAVAGYQALHNGDTNNYGDVTKIDWKSMFVDFLSWTFPCQSISSAGANDGFNEGSDTKSSLGWVIKRALKEMPHKPRTIFVENVANILSPKHRATFDSFVKYLQSEGYYVSYKKIDASKVGFPQHRDRVYLLATLGHDLQFEWPKERPLDFRLRDVLETNVDPKYILSTSPNNHMLDTAAANDGKRKMRLHNPSHCERAFCITTRTGNRNDDNFVLLDDVNTMPHLTITSSKLATYGLTVQQLREVGYRKLTPTEAMTLMGLKKGEQAKLLKLGLSDTKLYFLMGNAIVRPVLSEIFKGYFEALIKSGLLHT